MKRILAAPLAAALLGSSSMAETQQAATPPPSAGANAAKLAYIMVFVSDMKRSVAFYRDQLGLKLKFASPGWSEFETGETTLALHPASRENPPGSSQIGVTVADLEGFYHSRSAAGVPFAGPPKPQSYGSPLAEMRDPDGAKISVGAR